MTITYIFIIFLFINVLLICNCKVENIPALIWTSKEYLPRPDLPLIPVKSDLFESHVKNLFGSKKPLVVVFLEETLDSNDFDRRAENGFDSYPFLSNLSQSCRN